MKIALDLDDVVFDFTRPFLRFVNKERGTNFTEADYTQYSFERCGIVPPGTNDYYIRTFGKLRGFLSLPIRHGATDVIHGFQRLGHIIVYVSYRDIEFEEDTLAALNAAGIFHEVAFVNEKKTKKYEVLWQLGITHYVDDNPYAVRETLEHYPLCTTILMSTRLPDIRTAGAKLIAKNWQDVSNFLNPPEWRSSWK